VIAAAIAECAATNEDIGWPFAVASIAFLALIAFIAWMILG
jgi:hypothetical protein